MVAHVVFVFVLAHLLAPPVGVVAPDALAVLTHGGGVDVVSLLLLF